ncbi:MAG: phosphate ABC transporter substrate-binding protein PstS [Cyanobacteria bacterium RM1_2_2]|nr:phosphate ABC transporter substrate-binding protein PstS [Cyanobacteria bacterium RM1_2_2]
MNLKFRANRQMFVGAVAVITLGVAACGGTTTTPTADAPDATESPAATGTTETATGDLTATLTGAGASFPAPLYQRWFSEFNQEQPGVQVSYQSVGSGAGVEQFLAGTVDFGASDAPLTPEERQTFQQQYGAEPIQVPMTAGAVVFAYNLPGVEDLRLSREAYCGIVQGDIRSWNDPTIAAANPGVTLPDQPINWVYRSDGSGTTFIFTNHIDEACPGWQAGNGKSVSWPVGSGARGNEGITAQVQQTEGSVGYVEYAYAKENDISTAALENQSGNFVEPTPEAASLVFEGEEIPEDFALTVPDPENAQAYPIAGLTWLLLYPEYQDPAKAQALNAVIDWSLTEGRTFAEDLGYVPLSGSVVDRVQQTVDQSTDTASS